jgi:hypothetical protein
VRRASKVVDRALGALRDPSAEVRRAAVEVIERRLRVSGPGAHARRQVDRAFAALVTVLRADPEERVRHAAAYALTSWFQRRAAWALWAALVDERETPQVRGQAAEGIGNQLMSFMKLAPTRQQRVEAALAAGLADPAAEVRFWCLYAVGQMLLVDLRDVVVGLCGDMALCPWMWRVGEEAADVLTFFDAGVWPDREIVREG